MRFLSADLIFPISSPPITNGVLVLEDDGTIKEVYAENHPDAPDSTRIERFQGILCPGFVNSHCHLELSHMKGMVDEKTGLPEFVMEIVSRRAERKIEKLDRISDGDTEMWNNGIQAVGDICNTEDTLETKRKSKIRYHSFVEVFSFNSSKADEVLEEGIRVAKLYEEAGLGASIVPHAPYSVSEKLFSGIAGQQTRFSGTISMHNQETPSENQMFISASGELVELFKKFGEDFSHFHPNYKSSLDYSFNQLGVEQNIVLVHNTLTTAEEILWVNSQRNDVYFCTCPSANQYIENTQPDIQMWLEVGAKVCVGTDSLASNHQLSIIEELKLIEEKCPRINLDSLLRIATLTGAQALGFDADLGSLEKGKAPGVVLIENVDLQSLRLGPNATVKRLK